MTSKCKTCKYWRYSGFNMGNCIGITPEFKVVPLPPVLDKKGNLQKRGKLLRTRNGITGIGSSITTPEDFYCKNWSKK